MEACELQGSGHDLCMVEGPLPAHELPDGLEAGGGRIVISLAGRVRREGKECHADNAPAGVPAKETSLPKTIPSRS
eukprot:CAMPEP_0175474234 /NCGR_PEP_ID=MMETSP0095-20121207/74790_1 /TAXON_ID=311494 /ORGANISM="Alexandrium monilatum, Strain CCMP3105" /LENGTH=75 /DNA_ID=CAMNT_0016775751 /DNA_START=217 /DNA_END=441 /DNA_ORIENTATION=-